MAPELLPEIYLHSAQFISSPSTIANCCLVSKEFYRIFTPYLYKHLNLRTGPPNPDEKSEHDPTRALRRLRIAYLNDRFLFTKHFEISVHTGNDIIMSRYLSSMSNIVSFSADFNDTKAPYVCSALNLLPTRTLRDLELHVIDINTSPMSHQDPVQNQFTWPDLPYFQNLRSLKLFGLCDPMSRLARDIARVLIASPQLKILGLGMHMCDFIMRFGMPGLGDGTNNKLLIKEIIDEMQKLRVADESQLELEELCLGLGGLPGSPLPVEQAIRDISPLTRLEKLQVLQLINGDGVHTTFTIDSEAFYPCTSLRRLVVDILNDDISDIIQTLHSSSSNLVEIQIRRTHSQARKLHLGPQYQMMPVEPGLALLKTLGTDWVKMHLEMPSALESLFRFQENDRTYAKLEELSLFLTVGPNGTVYGLIGPVEHRQWALLRTSLVNLPCLRRLLLRFDCPVPKSVASSLASTLFSAHEDFMHFQNLPSNFTYITLKSSESEFFSFRRIFVPGSIPIGVETRRRAWSLVDVPRDETNDWNWDVTHEPPEPHQRYYSSEF